MPEPRFVADSHEALIELSRLADPPVSKGERAELVLQRRDATRRVVLESSLEGRMIVWREIER